MRDGTGVAGYEALARYHDVWDRAADPAVHGMPIDLKPKDVVDRTA